MEPCSCGGFERFRCPPVTSRINQYSGIRYRTTFRHDVWYICGDWLDLFACFRAQCSNIAEPSAIWRGWPQWLFRKLIPLLSYTPDAGDAGETLWTGAMRSEVKMGRLPGCRKTLHGGEAIPRLRRFFPIVQSGGIFNSPYTIEA